jgi:hypothetical protein
VTRRANLIPWGRGAIVPPVKKMVATAEFVYVGMKGNLFSFTYEVV